MRVVHISFDLVRVCTLCMVVVDHVCVASCHGSFTSVVRFDYKSATSATFHRYISIMVCLWKEKKTSMSRPSFQIPAELRMVLCCAACSEC